ncbi:threonine synthase [Bacillus sp. 2205SS5-2]|uniref:threonine synthase n=1 Tax=Bacillus sp. 2205SS5-2 TaxID=3109031 RepID=UPI00300502E7
MRNWQGLLKEYECLLPVTDLTPSLSLQEGNTPLIKLESLSLTLELNLYVKVEGANPTGSFKDRGMVLAVAKAKEAGSTTVICASTGNTSASAAAYAARAGMKCIVVIPQGKIAQGKLAQAVMYGAEIVAIDGNFDDALRIVKKLSETEPVTMVNSLNPYRLEGQKTGAFEICDALGYAPDVIALPVGNAGNISAYWRGFREYHKSKETGLPIMYGFQAQGAAPIVHNRIFPHPETIATAIRIGNPASWNQAIEAAAGSGGSIAEVSDAEIIHAYQFLAREEGIFAEPASCASLAGILKAHEQGRVKKDQTVVMVLTGNGLKDPETALQSSVIEPIDLPNDVVKVAQFIKERISV